MHETEDQIMSAIVDRKRTKRSLAPCRYRTLFHFRRASWNAWMPGRPSARFPSATTTPTRVFLVGDIVDGWRLKSGWYWPQSHNDVVQKLLRKVRKGARVIFVPGNHDEFARDFVGLDFGGVEVVDHVVHDDGRRQDACS